MKEDTRVRGPWADKKLPKTYSGKDLPTTLWPWQQEVLDRCMLSAVDDRVVNYIIDERGNNGKSKFCKYMGFHHGATVVPWGRTGDILNMVCKSGGAEIYLFDLSRSKPQDWARDDISAAMEQIKNGHVTNFKYETGQVYFDPPHVWCFSNSIPNLSSMSRDRWRFYGISDVRGLIPISWKSVHDRFKSASRDRAASPERIDID